MMKKIFHCIILFVLPVLFIILSLVCQNSKGEFYLNNRYDPSYVYLINSLNLSQFNGSGVGHFDHPGTTVQEIGAVVIYFVHKSSGKNNDIVTDVFNRPEYYLSKINLVFIFLNSTALFILGLTAFKKLNGIQPAILLQLTPLFSITIFFWIINVAPEPLIIFTILILISGIVCHISEENMNTKNDIIYAIGFGLICGFGLVTKISFFPVLIVPLILIKRISFKALFCLITIIAFLIFVLPAISLSHPYSFLNWIRKLILYSGKYGTGEKNFIDASNFLINLKTIFTNEPVFSLSYILILVTYLFSFIPKFRQKIKLSEYHNLLTGIFWAMTIQIFIVCKHFELHYLIPAFFLIVLGLYVVNRIANDLFPKLFIRSKYIYLYLLLAVFIFYQYIAFTNTISLNTANRDASHKVIEIIDKNYEKSLVVSSDGVSSREFALYLGASFGGTQKKNYYSVLKKMFPDNYYYAKWSKNLENVEDLITLKNKLLSSDKFVFQCDNEIVLSDFMKIIKEITGKENTSYKRVFTGVNGEIIYEIEPEQ